MIFFTRFRDLAASVACLRARKGSLKAQIEAMTTRLDVLRLRKAKPIPPPQETRQSVTTHELQVAQKAQEDAVKRVEKLTGQLDEVRRIRRELSEHQARIDQAIAECQRIDRLQKCGFE